MPVKFEPPNPYGDSVFYPDAYGSDGPEAYILDVAVARAMVGAPRVTSVSAGAHFAGIVERLGFDAEVIEEADTFWLMTPAGRVEVRR